MSHNYNTYGSSEKLLDIEYAVGHKASRDTLHGFLEHPIVTTVIPSLATVLALGTVYFTCTALHAVQVAYLIRVFLDASFSASDCTPILLAIAFEAFSLTGCVSIEHEFSKHNKDRTKDIWWQIEWLWTATWPSFVVEGFGLIVPLTVAVLRWTGTVADSLLMHSSA